MIDQIDLAGSGMVALPSLISLHIEMFFGPQPLATGTGFICRKGRQPFLVTNLHNFTGRFPKGHPREGRTLSCKGGVPDRIRIMHNRRGKIGSWVAQTELLFRENDERRWSIHPVHGESVDIAALPLSPAPDVQWFTYGLTISENPSIRVRVADQVSVVGFPLGIRAGGSLPVWVSGFVASEPVVDQNDLPLFFIDCRTRVGQSGSPVIAYRPPGNVAMDDGEVRWSAVDMIRLLGIYSGRVKVGMDLGMVWKTSAIADVVGAA